MIFKEIRERLTGVSCPIFGISWNPSETERTKANRIVRFLEDKRVLYNPYILECPDHCFHSIIEIRHFLTDEMQTINVDSELYGYLKAMRIACRKFMNKFSTDKKVPHLYIENSGCINSWIFNSTLGELRGSFGIMLAQMAVAYGIDIEDDLATILPEKDCEE